MAVDQNKLRTEKPSLWRLTFPIYIEYLLAMLVGNLDQFMISRYDPTGNSVTAIGNANQVLNLLVLTFSIIGLATTVLITQYIGAGRPEQTGTVYTLAVFVNLALSVAISLFLVLGADWIFDFMHPPEWVRDDFRAYVQIVGGFLFFQAMFTTLSAIFKSNSLMRPIMLLSVLMNLINLVLNLLLIYGVGPFPELGIRGVAIATVISRVVVVAILFYLYFRSIGVNLSPKQLWPFPGAMMKRMAVIGLPSAGESISYNITLLIIMKMINDFGQDSINTKLYAGMFAMITWMFASSISQASGILIGYFMGGRELDAANRQVMRTLVLSLLVTGGIAVLLWACSDPLFGIVTENHAVIRLGKIILGIDIALEIGRAVNIVMVRALQATGDINFPIGLGICSTWLLAVGLSWLLGVQLGWGLKGVWIAMASDELTRATIFLFRWRSGVWRTKHVIEEQPVAQTT